MNLRTLRTIAVIGAVLLMLGEAYRSWGAGRPVAFWMDDMLAGGLMIWAAWKVQSGSARSHALFAGSWGIAVGMLYGSFFGKVFDPAGSNPGNFSLGVLTMLVGLAFVIAMGGLIASILLAQESDAR